MREEHEKFIFYKNVPYRDLKEIIFNSIKRSFPDAIVDYNPKRLRYKKLNNAFGLDISIPSIKVIIRYDGKESNPQKKILIDKKTVYRPRRVKCYMKHLDTGLYETLTSEYKNKLSAYEKCNNDYIQLIKDVQEDLSMSLEIGGYKNKMRVFPLRLI